MSLFDNPMIASALKAMTPEQLKEYEQIGKYMFSTDFTANNPGQKMSVDEEMRAVGARALSYVKSGLHPNDLSEKECTILNALKGNEWWKEFGYTANEVRWAQPGAMTTEKKTTLPSRRPKKGKQARKIALEKLES